MHCRPTAGRFRRRLMVWCHISTIASLTSSGDIRQGSRRSSKLARPAPPGAVLRCAPFISLTAPAPLSLTDVGETADVGHRAPGGDQVRAAVSVVRRSFGAPWAAGSCGAHRAAHSWVVPPQSGVAATTMSNPRKARRHAGELHGCPAAADRVRRFPCSAHGSVAYRFCDRPRRRRSAPVRGVADDEGAATQHLGQHVPPPASRVDVGGGPQRRDVFVGVSG